MNGLTVGSLCSGIGGLDLGLERAGMRVVWHAEVDPPATAVLARRWPAVPNLGDITTINWSTVERPDVIAAGYPCQPFSSPGRRRGAADERHLWPYVADAVRHLRPRWVLLENVAGHLGLGFDAVLADLARLGFDAEWSLVSACSLGAPHMRERLFCVAYPAGKGPPDWRPATHLPREAAWRLEPQRPGSLPSWAIGSAEPLVGREAHGLPGRVDRVKCLGRAVVPQVAECVGRLIVVADRGRQMGRAS